jgi:F-type H+-transporting ATPase subunit epsilon
MATFPLELVAPEKILFSGEIVSVVIPSASGEMQVMAGHSPVIALLQPGIISIDQGGGTSRRLFVRGGLAEVRPDQMAILADHAVPVEELNATALATEIASAEKALAAAKTDEQRRNASTMLAQLTRLRDSGLH